MTHYEIGGFMLWHIFYINLVKKGVAWLVHQAANGLPDLIQNPENDELLNNLIFRAF